MKKIILVLIIISIALTGCSLLNTQATREKGEPYTCWQARYQSREGNHEAARILAQECPTEVKREWCLKVLKERPEVFKDFNDCWRQ
jgi:uncharacterized protein YceK